MDSDIKRIKNYVVRFAKGWTEGGGSRHTILCWTKRG
jgi:hypothetical protein